MSKQQTKNETKRQNEARRAAAKKNASAAVETTQEKSAPRVSTVERDVFNMKLSSNRAQLISEALIKLGAPTMKQLSEYVLSRDKSIGAISNHVRYMLVHDMLKHDAKNKSYSFTESAQKLLKQKGRVLFAHERSKSK